MHTALFEANFRANHVIVDSPLGLFKNLSGVLKMRRSFLNKLSHAFWSQLHLRSHKSDGAQRHWSNKLSDPS